MDVFLWFTQQFVDGKPLQFFAWGAITAICFSIGAFFWRFWRNSGDRLFAIFSLAFFILGVERLFLIILKTKGDMTAMVFVARLIAFTLIIVAIVDKNRLRR